MEKKYLQLNDIDAYKTAFNLSNYVWEIVVKWDWFAKRTKPTYQIHKPEIKSLTIEARYAHSSLRGRQSINRAI